MIVFKTFLKVLNKCKIPIIMYTVFLLFFSVFNMNTSDNSTNFVSTKPSVLIINNDIEVGITKNLIDYIEKNSKIVSIKNDKDLIADALFYRDVNYIIYIPSNFRKDFLDHKDPKIEIKSTGDYSSSLAEMMLERYLKIANIYNQEFKTEAELIENINDTLLIETEVKVNSKLDSNMIEKASFYYNFVNYCLLAGCIYVICLILSSFKDEKIRKRTIISSINYKNYNRKLLLSNGLFAVVLWGFYVILSMVLLKGVMFSVTGLIYIINSFIFTLCTLTLAFMIANLVTDKNAINGIVNVIALGSSFLCGAFVPMELLPTSVLKIAHILPSYWYIKTNELLKDIEIFNLETLRPILINMVVMVGFVIIFIIITNFISRKKRKID